MSTDRPTGGGPAPIPHSRPSLGPAEARAVAEAVASGQVAQGPRVAAFEAVLAAAVGTPGGVAVGSGTAALHLALLALGVGAGDEVLIPSFTCAALLHAVRAAGAAPRPVDVDPVTFDMDPDAARRARTARTRAVIAVHAFGRPADMGPLTALGVPVVEDAAQALGATAGGRPVGGAGAVGVFSFYATKLITTGEGGMLVASDPRILDRARDLREYDEKLDDRPRFNYKMTDLQAALGLVQAARLPEFLARRRALADRYRARLGRGPLRQPADPPHGRHAWHRYVVAGPRPAADYLSALHARGVVARPPIFRPLHRDLGLDGFPGAEEAWAHAVSLPLYPALDDADAERVMAAAEAAAA
jgi:dTDP-4-amino-4,6-dideoxygalactose transaminase